MDAFDRPANRKSVRSITTGELLEELGDIFQKLGPDRRNLLTGAVGMDIGEQLRTAIQKSGQTHYAIGKQAGVATAAVDRFVSGERDITLGTAAKIAAALGFTLTGPGTEPEQSKPKSPRKRKT